MEMIIDPVQLSKSLSLRQDDDTLRNKVVHLVLDFRMGYVEKHMRELQREIILASGDNEKMMRLMQEFKDMQQIRNAIAKELGSDIIV